MSAPKCNNNRISSGLPHSEIDGSKPILSSPSLIAEYHVLHRLLLPRHPPNALLALDLIQKKTSSFSKYAPTLRSARIKSITFPQSWLVHPGCAPPETGGLVSVLDLEDFISCVAAGPGALPVSDMKSMCISLYDVKSSIDWMAKPLGLTIKSEDWWSLSGSNR